MAGNILYGIKKFGISVVTIIARVVITLIQLLVEVSSLAVKIIYLKYGKSKKTLLF